MKVDENGDTAFDRWMARHDRAILFALGVAHGIGIGILIVVVIL